MATDTADGDTADGDATDGLSGHLRGVTVTTVATLSGIAAAIASQNMTGGVATDPRGVLPLGAAMIGQLLVMRLLGVDVEEFSRKDSLYVAFMTFSLWFVAWGILLSANAL